MLNGNRCQNTKLNLLHLNKGNSNFENKMDEIKNVLQTHKPDIMTIAEANLNLSKCNILTNFPDHNVEVNKMSKIISNSRNILIINKNISYKRR